MIQCFLCNGISAIVTETKADNKISYMQFSVQQYSDTKLLPILINTKATNYSLQCRQLILLKMPFIPLIIELDNIKPKEPTT